MIPYPSLAAAESALNRPLTYAETIWFKYSATMPDPLLYYHNTLFLFIIFTLVPLPLALLELYWPSVLKPFKIQQKVYLLKSEFLECYKNVIKIFFLVVCPLQLLSYPTVKFVGIRTGLPLPSIWEVAAQLVVYFLLEDFGNYWIHRWLHGKWGYEKIHKVHHEYTTPIGFAAPYAHWAEVLILGIPSFLGPAIAPGHMITLWLWIALRQIEALDTHSGPFDPLSKGLTALQVVVDYRILNRYDFPLSFTKFIPFYGGAEYHDYHHYVGGQSQSNFASVFTYCDYLYGTDKGYRYQKACLAKMRGQLELSNQNGVGNLLQNQKSD